MLTGLSSDHFDRRFTDSTLSVQVCVAFWSVDHAVVHSICKTIELSAVRHALKIVGE